MYSAAQQRHPALASFALYNRSLSNSRTLPVIQRNEKSVGFYLRQADKAGQLGSIGFVLTFLGTLVLTAQAGQLKGIGQNTTYDPTNRRSSYNLYELLLFLAIQLSTEPRKLKRGMVSNEENILTFSSSRLIDNRL